MSIKIKRALRVTYPEHDSFFAQLKTIPKLTPRSLPLPEAVVRVVTGQMLSGAAANTIYKRIATATREQGLVGSWQLDHDSLRNCGLSDSKARTICAFGSKIGNDASALEHWRTMAPDALTQEIKSNKGMGDWTAAIISLGYIGHEDVFPWGDGSLQRAVAVLQRAGAGRSRRYKFDPDRARPYRSYLALYLWQALDSGILD